MKIAKQLMNDKWEQEGNRNYGAASKKDGRKGTEENNIKWNNDAIINLKTTSEVKETPVGILRALKGKSQGFHIIYNMLACAFSGQHHPKKKYHLILLHFLL